jgi:hypothetical protein
VISEKRRFEISANHNSDKKRFEISANQNSKEKRSEILYGFFVVIFVFL